MGMHQAQLTHNYRSDIDGLRALAVVSVVIFHAFAWLIPGGYAGVDVFFVISGYLITTNILNGLNESTFTIQGFYQRRIRRIFPALVTMLAIVYAFGWFVLLATEYRQLGKHVGSGASFISNIILWQESGYFDTSSAVKPLTHLWSLGIEEQFYIVWPLLLWAIFKLRLHILTSTVVLAVVSFGFGLWSLNNDVVGAYYSPINRFWELLIGAILAAVMLKRTYGDKATKWQQAGSIVGLILIVFTLFSLDGQSSFPGWNALAPTVGAALMIGCGPQTLTARRIFSLRAIVWVGLISFPLYLWHWPLLTFARIISSAMPTAQVRIGAVVLSVVLSWATYRLIEKPLRFHPRVKVITGALVASMVVIGLVGYVTFRNDGIASREVTQMNPDINSGEEGGAQGWVQDTCGISDAKVADLFASCLEDNRETPRFALIGDSKAEALIGGFIRTSTENGRWLFMGGNSDSGVPVPLISDAPEFERFQKLARIAVDSVASNPDIDVVVLEGAIRAMFGIADETSFVQVPESLYYDIVTEGFRNSITILTQAGKKVVLYIDNPPLPNPEDCLQRKTTIGILNRLLVNPNPLCEMPIQTFIDQTAKYYLMFEQLKREFPGQVDIFDATEIFCGSEDRICRHVRWDRFMYSYTDHPSDYAAGIIGQNLNPFLESLAP
jgi:peptidoglycan/LPS O-acetylase OafA/YrhL